MTPVREALELARKRIEYLGSFGHPRHQNANEKEFFPVIDAAIASLSAAPGEPCAVKPLEWVDEPNREPENPAWNASNPFGLNYRIFKAWWGARDKWAFMYGSCFHHTVDEAKASAQADYEQRIRSALVTTPQPAAGWDDSLLEIISVLDKATGDTDANVETDEEYRAEHPVHWAMQKLCELRESLRREAPASGATKSAPPNTASHNSGERDPSVMPDSSGADAREAPAPAEGVTDTQLHDWVQYLDWDTSLSTDDEVKQLRSLLSRIGFIARPDTAEARLRELEPKLAVAERMADGITAFLDKPNWRPSRAYIEQSRNVIKNMVRNVRKALSPPSGGDEAKESEGGGPNVHAINGPFASPSRTYVRQLVDDPNSSSGKSLQDVEVSPSEPSPPADRREIVARECADELVLTVEAAERVAKRTGNTFVLDRQRIAKMIAGCFAALDGGRAALAQSEEKK